MYREGGRAEFSVRSTKFRSVVARGTAGRKVLRRYISVGSVVQIMQKEEKLAGG